MSVRSDRRTNSACLALVVLLAVCARVNAQDRMPPIPAEQMTDAQKQAVAEYVAARGGTGVSGPWVPLLRAPELLNPVRMVSDYVRTKSSLPPKLRELVILIMVREWTIQFEWPGHSRAAVTAGLKADVVSAIGEGRRPSGMAEDEEMVYNFVSELNRRQGVSDATYARVLGKLGERGIMDMTGLAGYMAVVGMNTSVARTPPAGGAAPALSALSTR